MSIENKSAVNMPPTTGQAPSAQIQIVSKANWLGPCPWTARTIPPLLSQRAQTARDRSGRPLHAAAVLIGAVIGRNLRLRMASLWCAVVRCGALGAGIEYNGVKLIGVCWIPRALAPRWPIVDESAFRPTYAPRPIIACTRCPRPRSDRRASAI